MHFCENLSLKLHRPCCIQYENENTEKNDVWDVALQTARVRVSKCRHFHVYTWAVDNWISLTAFIGRDVKGAAEAALICSRRLTADVPWLRCSFAPALHSEMKVSSQAVCNGLFVYIPSLGHWMLILLLFLEVYAHVVTPVSLCVLLFWPYSFYYSDDTVEPHSSFFLLQIKIKLPRCCITSGNLGLDWHAEVYKMALWESIPFMVDCCDHFALPPLPLLAATVRQDKQTSRQLSRGLGLLWRICQGSLPPSPPQWGIPISASDSLGKLEVVPLTNFLWHGKDRNHMWEHPHILFQFNIDLRARPLAGLVVSMWRTEREILER